MSQQNGYASGSIPGLNEMQEYIGRETVEQFRLGQIGRRALLRKLIIVCGSATGAATLLAACGEDAGDKTMGELDAAAPDAAAGIPDAGTPDATAAPGDARGAALSVPADHPEVQGMDVTYPNGDVRVLGYLARPRAAGNHPAVIVIHENRGLTDHIRDVARRLAKARYVALAPDLASRGGGTARLGDMATRFFSMEAKPEELVSDLSAGLDFLAATMGVRPTDAFGVTGFCMGGSYTLRLAAANPRVVAAVPYYGPAPSPIDQMKNTNAAILAHYAEMDDNVNRTRDMLEMVLKDAGKTFEKRIHPGTRHAFNNDTGQNYNEAAAVAAWTETLAWLDRHLRR